MRPRLTFPRLLGTCLLACVVAMLVGAPAGFAIGNPTVAGGSPQYTAATSATIGWSGVGPDPLYDTVTYDGDLSGAAFGPTAGTSTPVTFGVAGTYTFRVRATETSSLDPLVPAQTGGYGVATIVVDRTPPTISVALTPATPNGDNGWYTSLTITWSCNDNGAPVTFCPASGPYTTQGANQTQTGTATNAAGLTSPPVTTPIFNFDRAAPRQATLRQPTPRATVTSEPTFVWAPPTGGTETSGYNRYEVWARIGGTYRKIAQVPFVPGQAEYRATRDPALWPTVIPKGVSTSWYVRTVDNAGNGGGGTGQARTFTINPNAPAAPTITGGPSGLTNQSSPTFSWSGDQPAFSWGVFAADNDTPVRTGSGAAPQATPVGLGDGAYTFRVSQVSAFGDDGAEAARDFTVDTSAPAAPVITSRPSFPTSDPAPAFSWSMEPGASARWQVLASGGGVVQGSDTPSSSAKVSPLANGAYVFRVVQIDGAGNVSPATSDPFSIAGAAAAAPKIASLISLLPLQNAKKLSPRAGRTLLTRTPVLQWTKGPKGTTLYNVQLFKVIRKRPSLPPVVQKVYSSFPKTTQLRLPRKATLAGTCYVWRVWPYTGKRFTKAPLGISNFCIASAKTIAKAAKAGKAKTSA